MDVVKTRLQTADATFSGMADCYRHIILKEGVGALFKGVVPRTLIVSPLFAITVMIYEIQQRFIAG